MYMNWPKTNTQSSCFTIPQKSLCQIDVDIGAYNLRSRYTGKDRFDLGSFKARFLSLSPEKMLVEGKLAQIRHG